jgi:hypothetical protein
MEFNRENIVFKNLWDAHPANNSELQPCIPEEVKPFENQCCIRFSAMLDRCGFDLGDYDGLMCWHNHDEWHALRCEDMAKYLKKKLGEPEYYSHPDISLFYDRKGFIVFFDFYNGSGDHVEIWNGKEQAWGCDDYFSRSPKLWFFELD